MIDDDDALETRLRTLAAVHDAPPAHVSESAKAVWELRDLDAELAALVADSWADSDLVATRDHLGTLRMLTFARDGGSVEIDVEHDPVSGLCRLRGFVVGGVGDLLLERTLSSTSIPVTDGQFDVEHIDRGPARFIFGTEDGRRVMTTWVSL